MKVPEQVKSFNSANRPGSVHGAHKEQYKQNTRQTGHGSEQDLCDRIRSVLQRAHWPSQPLEINFDEVRGGVWICTAKQRIDI